MKAVLAVGLGLGCGSSDGDISPVPDPGPIPVPPTENGVPVAEVRLDFEEGTGPTVGSGKTARFLRGIWEPLIGISDDEATGVQQIKDRIARLRGSGINAVFLWVVSRYVAAVREPAKYGSSFPMAGWDPVARYVALAHEQGMSAHLWYSPMAYKDSARAPELDDQPSWRLRDGTNQPLEAVDLAVDEAAAYELSAIKFIADRYRPDGVQLEEPYFPAAVPTSAGFATKFQTRFGYATTEARTSQVQDIAALKGDVITDFVEKTRQALLSVDPRIALQATGGFSGIHPDLIRAGLDVPRLRDAQLLDGFAPQAYFTNLNDYTAALAVNRDNFQSRMSILMGTGIRWYEIASGSNAAAVDQVQSVESAVGADAVSGSILFSYSWFENPTLAFAEAGLKQHVPELLLATLGAKSDAESTDPKWISGRSSKGALEFDGTDDFLMFPSTQALDEYGAFTLSVWVRASAPQADVATIFQRGDQSETTGFLWLYLQPDSTMHVQMSDGTALLNLASSPLSITDGKWHHVAVVQNRADRSVVFYTDGVEAGRAGYAKPTIPAVRGPAWIGTYGGRVSAEYMFKGALDDFRFHRRALTPDQVRTLAKP